MLYLIPIPIVIIAAMVKILSVRYGLKIFSMISSIVILLGVLFFLYSYASYNGYNIITIIKNFFGF